jgi:cytochrome c biogenesis protein CcdA
MMPIASIGAGLLAGILSTLSPCVFPLLPLVIGAATSTHRSGAYWLAGGVATSYTIAGLFVATIGFAIGLDGDLFRTISAVLLLLLGLALLSATIQARLGVAHRRRLSQVFKERTPEPLRTRIYGRSPTVHGDPLGPSVEDLKAKGKSWDDIIESAARPGYPLLDNSSSGHSA